MILISVAKTGWERGLVAGKNWQIGLLACHKSLVFSGGFSQKSIFYSFQTPFSQVHILTTLVKPSTLNETSGAGYLH